MASPTWNDPIQSYFTSTDVGHMKQVTSGRIDLSSYQSVSSNGSIIYSMVSGKQMPPGNPWSDEWIATFSAWKSAGYPES
jgi:hypothetical protein